MRSSRVKKGELLVELDTSSLEDKTVEQQIRVQNAETGFIRARENLEVVKNQAESDIARAILDFQFAGEDLIQYRELVSSSTSSSPFFTRVSELELQRDLDLLEVDEQGMWKEFRPEKRSR